MKNYKESQNRFPLSEKSPSDFQQYARNNEELFCADIAAQLGEPNMRFILARRHQLGMQAINDAYAAVKDSIRNGQCRNPRKLFNGILTKELKRRTENINH